jgi:hypothetical protein
VKTIRDEAKKQSASFYLTLVSIIQSFALGFLLSTVGSVYAASPTLLWPYSNASLITWLQIVVVFQAVVLCWHVNINNAIIMHRLIGLSDSYIPFVFAIPQYLMISAIQSRSLPLWFFGMAGYSTVSFWAYTMMYRKDAKEPENAEVFRVLGWFPLFNRLYTLSALPLFVSVGFYFYRNVVTDPTTVLWLVFQNLLFGVFTYAHYRSWKRLTTP